MKTLTTRQADLDQRRDRTLVPLVRLRFWTDRTAQTPERTLYLSDRTLTYTYDGAERTFLPLVESIGQLRATMVHLPVEGPVPSSGESSRRRRLDLTLLNRLLDGTELLGDAIETDVGTMASLEIAQLWLDTPKEPLAGHLDDAGVPSTAPLVVFRGDVVSVVVGDDEIRVEAESTLPQLSWRRADGATTDPKDVGKRLPVPVGVAKNVELIGYDVGRVSTLATAALAAATTLDLTDATDFASGGGDGTIGTDTFSWGAKSGNTLTSVTGLTADHSVGEVVLVTPVGGADFVVSDGVIEGVDAVYVVSPFTGERTRITTGYSIVDDASLVPGGTVTAVHFTQAQLQSLVDALVTEVTVTQPVVTQPIVAHAVSASVEQQPTSGESTLLDGNISTGIDGDDTLPATGTPMVFASVSGTFTSQIVHVYGKGDFQVRNSAGDTVLFSVASGPEGWYHFETTNSSNTLRCLPLSGATNEMKEIWRSVNFAAASPSLSQNVSLSAIAVAGASVGFGLRLLADVQGIEALDGDYTAATGTAFETAEDVVRYLLETRAGSTVNETAMTAYATAMGAHEFAGDLRELGVTFEELASRLSAMLRTNLVSEELSTATEWKPLAATTDTWTWPTPGAADTIEVWGRLQREQRDARGAATRYRMLYLRDPSVSDDEESFAKLREVSVDDQAGLTHPSLTELQNAEKKLGDVEAPLFLNSMIQNGDATTAAQVLGFYAHEGIRLADARTFRLSGVPPWEAWRLELGDLVTLDPSGLNAKARVIEYSKSWDSPTSELVLVEVQ